MIWYYLDGSEQKGPISDAELGALLGSGRIDNHTLIWREGMAEWKSVAQVNPDVPRVATISAPPPIAKPIAPAGFVVCSECNGVFPEDEVIRHGNACICAQCKPVFLQKLKEGVAVDGTLRYAGFGIRFAAIFVDGLILMPLNLLSGWAIGAPMDTPLISKLGAAHTVINTIVACAMYTFFVGRMGATPGKLAARLRVVNADGSKVSYGKAFARYFASNWISGLFTLCIGYLMVCWDPEKRGLHDRICNTRVIYK